ncbi:hypothetical protein NFI96_014343 [Prochilodus magdalenae]|nr:hypothetical protein NFI96_014343 [Prochilodus magdalenae]
MGSLLVGLLLVLIPKTSECLQYLVQPDEVSAVTLSTSLPLDQCSICELKDQGNTDCVATLKIEPSKNVTVDFKCSEPQKTVSVLIERRLECTTKACTPAQGNVPASLLSDFNRKFVWELRAPAEMALIVDFPGDGLKKVPEGKNCEDGYSYTVATNGSDAIPQSQPYCRNGSVAQLELPNQATVTLQVPQQEKPALTLFTVMPKNLLKKGRTMIVVPDPNTWVVIRKKADGPECTVCVGEGPSRTCGSEQILSEPQTTKVEFSCSKPQDLFTVEVNKDFDCSKDCNYDTIYPEGSFFTDFNRTFIWDLKVGTTMAYQLDFPAPGMRQIASSDHCSDKHTYTIFMYPRTGPLAVGTFCRNGTISRIQGLYKCRLRLEVPRDTALTPSDFKYSKNNGKQCSIIVFVCFNKSHVQRCEGPILGSASVVVDAALPRGQTNTDFSANDIPSNYVMKWNFNVPTMHNVTIELLTKTLPKCQNNEIKVIYQQDNVLTEKSLDQKQPTNLQGNFNLSLMNCDAFQKPSLSLSYMVSVFRSGYPVHCIVDLQNVQGLSLEIENTNPASLCELRKDSVLQKKIMVPPNSRVDLSFLDCPSEELFLTATKTIECQSLPSCSVTGHPLTIPPLESCLPTLRQFKWDLRVPEQGSVELSASQGNLQQSLPEQGCDGSVSLLVSDTDGSDLGQFCSRGNQGTIQKVQMFSNVTITAKADGNKELSQQQSFLNVSFRPEITDKFIYTLSPLVSTSVLLATPNWPEPMKSDSTISWIVTVPEEYSAELLLLNVSQPRCDQSHTRVVIQEINSQKELGFREDEKYDEKYDIQSSFYFNMSNCEPERGAFAVLSKISLQKKTRKLLSIILAVVGALLAVMIIILAVVCVVVRKKKRELNRSSIYIPKGPVSLPGDASFSKLGETESPVYASIDDTMVYGHLLAQDGHTDRGPGNFNGHQMGTYRTFTGPKDTSIKEVGSETDAGQRPERDVYRPFLDPSQTFIPSRPRTPLGPIDSMGYEDHRMVHNELYTFKNPGDPTPIRLSAVEPLQPPEPETSSWSESDEAEPHYDMPDM